MEPSNKLPQNLQDALKQGAIKRLPLTFLPFINQQIEQWEYLFPNERRSIERLLLYVASLSPERSSAAFHDVLLLEEKMGVRHWQFSTSEQTIQNSSQLARSPYFQQWRRAVQAVFDAADQNVLRSSTAGPRDRNRLVLIEIPKPLAVSAETVWQRWQGIGNPVHLDLFETDLQISLMDLLLAGPVGDETSNGEGLLKVVRCRKEPSPTETWVIDAGSSLMRSAITSTPLSAAAPTSIALSYERLDSFRRQFSREMNTMRKDLADADAVFDRLRKVDVSQWCPPEVASDPATREFVRSLYLSGNGAVIFGNSFVQWGASEAFRRARPSLLAAKFGVRAKPKAFTGVAVFDNPDQVNPVPSVDDLSGSAEDAEILALYVWLAATRYAEYQQSTVCVCLADSIAQAYVVAPAEFPLRAESQPVSLQRLGEALSAWIA
ncbi:MAG: hypothetical protein WBY75_11100 [Terracidiphilus sp.]